MRDMSFNIDPMHEFSWELSCITTDFYREIAVEALKKVPDYFWFVPASSSGKHHPKNSLGMGGLARHVKAVFYIAEELLTHPTLYPCFAETEKDEIRVAILIHDACKQGFDAKANHTLHIHPLLPREHLKPEMDRNPIIDVAWDNICRLVETHMGPWIKDRKDENSIELEEPISPAQEFVHMCDFLASRSAIEVDVTGRNAEKGYVSPSMTEPATQAQIDYLTSLYNKAKSKKLNLNWISKDPIKDTEGNVLISKAKASEIIDKLKEMTK
jgi:hypothetical protein